MSLKVLPDFTRKIAETFNWKMAAVEETFDFSEDKEGFFWAKLRPKRFLDKPDFVMLCRLVKDLKGEDYLQGARAWKVPSAYAKKEGIPPSGSSLPAPIKASGQSTAQTSPPLLGQTILKDDTQVYMPIALPLTALVHMAFRSRISIDGPDFEELVESVKEHGILEPLVVRFLKTGFYEIVAGERRFRAAERAGLQSVPTVIRPLTDEQSYEVQLIENIQRKDLSDMEKARMLDYMVKNFNCTQEHLAKKLGKSKQWVSQHIAMLELEKVHPGELTTGDITERQAREILAAPKDKQEQIVDEINKTGEVPSAREIHAIVHGEEPKGLKPGDVTPGKAREILDTPAGKEVLEAAVKEKLAEGPREEVSESEDDDEPLYADSIETVPEKDSEPAPKPHEGHAESIPSPKETPHAKTEEIDTGFEFCCPECQDKFQILHVKCANGKVEHRLEAKG